MTPVYDVCTCLSMRVSACVCVRVQSTRVCGWECLLCAACAQTCMYVCVKEEEHSPGL